MILGTHNSMTYLSPKKWYLKPIKFLARCQSVDYKTQAEKYNVKAFDLRLFWNKRHELEYRHGFFSYDASNIDEFLTYCNKHNMYVRVLFEYRTTTEKRNDIEDLKNMFKEICQRMEEKYTNVKFYGGKITDSSEQLYYFDNDIQDLGLYSSVTTLFPKSSSQFLRNIDDWCPWIYAKLKNHQNKKVYNEKYKNDDIIIHYDFINIG